MTTVLATASSTTRCAARRPQQKELGICRHEVAAKQAAKAKVTGRFAPQVHCGAEQVAESGDNSDVGWEQPLDGVLG
jgi:hypothetical protein